MRFIVIAVLSFLLAPYIGSAQTTRAAQTEEPPLVQEALSNATNAIGRAIDRALLSGEPDLPLGPADVLKEYEAEMIRVSNRLSAELASISQARRDNRIGSDEAEYLMADRYRVAMMQHEVLSALHDSLEIDLVGTTPVAPAVGVLNIDWRLYQPLDSRP